MNISKVVDARIEQLRQERTDLEDLRQRLEAKEAELEERELSLDSSGVVKSLEDRKQALENEISELTEDVKRLANERVESVSGFGAEMKNIREELTSEANDKVKRLEADIDSLENKKANLESDIRELASTLSDLEEKHVRDLDNISKEKENFLAQKRLEREAALKELSAEHAMIMAEHTRQKKEAEAEIAALTQHKTIEWEKIEAEISRYKSVQLAEIEVLKEQMLADIEKERAVAMRNIKADEKQQLAAIERHKKDWSNELQNLQERKQEILNDIDLLQYEYEKTNSENILRLERAKVDEAKALSVIREEALSKLEVEQEALAAQHEKKAAGVRKKLQDERNLVQKEIAELATQKSGLKSEIEVLRSSYESKKAEFEANMEVLRAEKSKEIDEMRTLRLKEIEDLRKERLARLEVEHASEVSKHETRLGNMRKNFQEKQTAFEVEIERLEAKKISLQTETENLNSKLESHRLEVNTQMEALKLEKMKEIDELCLKRLHELDELRKERLLRLGNEYEAKRQELESQSQTQQEKIKEKQNLAAAEIAQMEARKNELQSEIDALDTKLQSYKVEISSQMEEYKGNKMKEIDELSLTRLQEVESMRQEQISKLQKERDDLILEQQNYVSTYRKRIQTEIEEMEKRLNDKIEEINKSREEKQELFNKTMAESEEKADEMRQSIQSLQKVLSELTLQTQQVREENETLRSTALIERRVELEKLTNEKMAEVESICSQKLNIILDTEKRIESQCRAAEKAATAKVDELKAQERELEMQIENLAGELSAKKAEGLSEIEKAKIDATEDQAKLKLQKMQEIDMSIESYKQERLDQAHQDIERQIALNYKKMEELAELNKEYNKRDKDLQELATSLEADKRSMYFREKRLLEEQAGYKNLLQNEIDAHRKEMTLLIEAKEQQILLLQEQIKTYAQEMLNYREEAAIEGGKTKKELSAEVRFLNERVNVLTTSLQNKPTDAYIIEIEEKAKGIEQLEQENKKLVIRVAGLEKERHNWQIAVNEISKLAEEKILLEERLSLYGNS